MIELVWEHFATKIMVLKLTDLAVISGRRTVPTIDVTLCLCFRPLYLINIRNQKLDLTRVY